jgi:sarcosine oxidase gamma subunit
MMTKGRAIVTEFSVTPAGGLVALDLWHGADHAQAAAALGIALPGPGQALDAGPGTVLRVGPRRWWLDGCALSAEVPAALGVATALGGGWNRVRLTGDGWRDLVMQSGLIDAEHGAFGPGTVAVTPLAHVRCVVHVRAAAECDIFVPRSYTEHCLSLWRGLGWRETAQVSAANGAENGGTAHPS